MSCLYRPCNVILKSNVIGNNLDFIFKSTFLQQSRLLSKIATANRTQDENDDINIKKSNQTTKFKNDKTTTSEDPNQLYTNKNILLNETDILDNKEFHLYYRPSNDMVKVTSPKCDYVFLKNHCKYAYIDTQIENYFQNGNKELTWQEITFDARNFYRPYLKLSKIRLTGLVVISAMGGFAIAPGEFILSKFLMLSAGVLFTSAAANSINQFFEVPFDSQMNRTKNRPIVCGNISPQVAVYFAITSATIGTTILYCGLNPLTAILGAGNIVLYTLIYTPLKRISIANTWVGSIVGGIPPIMGWTAVTGTVDPGALLLGAFLFAWQFPHFCALSWNIKADYSRAGYQMMSTVAPGLCLSTSLRYSLLLTPVCLLFSHLGVTTWHFAAVSMAPNLYIGWLAWRFYKDADAKSSRKLFHFSLVYLPVVFSLMLLTKS